MFNLLRNLALIVASSLLALELFSFIAVQARLLPFNDTPWIYRRPEFGFGWRTEVAPWGPWHRVHARDRHRRACFDVAYQSNNAGARDGDFTLTKTDGRKRFLLLGDSFAEGWGVDIADTAQARLEETLGIDVYNFGVAPYVGPVQYFLIYDALAKNYEHDGTIIFFLPQNDFTDNDIAVWGRNSTAYRPYYEKAADGGYAVVYPPGTAPNKAPFFGAEALTAPENWLLRYTFAANAIRSVKYLFAGNAGHRQGYSGYFDATPAQQDAAVAFLERIVAAEAGKAVFILAIPSPIDLYRIKTLKQSYAGQPWRQKLASLEKTYPHMVVIDMAPLMPDDVDRFFLSCDGHWNAAGNALAAEVVAARLRPREQGEAR